MSDENKKLVFEIECDAPENWETENILQRDGKGNVLSVDIPDDEEVDEYAEHDQA